MGCDIHAVIQYIEYGKGNDKEGWITIPCDCYGYKENRDYVLFNWLAGVRGGYFDGPEPLAYTGKTGTPHARGLPEGFELSPLPKNHPEYDDNSEFYYWIDDSEDYETKGTFKYMGEHTYSFLFLEEIFEAEERLTENQRLELSYFLKPMHQAWSLLHEKSAVKMDVRIVFGFDS